MALTLPPLRDKNLNFAHFPTVYQCFIYRNWETVTPKKLAEILGTDEATVLKAADDMGLDTNIEVDPMWYEAGYITIIRNNWHLITYEQLCNLLEWDKDKLAYVLKEDDFLSHKLGGFKPDCPELKYFPLSAEQQKATEAIKKATLEIRNQIAPVTVKPFDFNEMFKRSRAYPQIVVPDKERFETRIVYSYCALYGDTFISGMDYSFSDELLAAYSAIGVNGIWCQAVLYTLVPFPYMPELSENYEARLEGLVTLTEKMAKYGIKLYLYMNEPRSMPREFFDHYPNIKGADRGDFISMCTSTPEVQKYLYDSAALLASRVPKLGGFITITASENQTNCYSHFGESGQNCPICKNRTKAEVIGEVNKILYEGAASVIPDFKLIAWTWGWSREDNEATINAMPAPIVVQAVSERFKEKTIAGVTTSVEDYSISVVGPGDYALDVWKKAKDGGHKAYAKLQLNNTWECAAVPFLPVFEQVYTLMCNLIKVGVGGLMLDWTLGGYPSLTFAMLKAMFYESETIPTLDSLYRNVFPADTVEIVKEACHLFSDAFDKYPFHIGNLYCGPQNVGTGNLFWPEKTGWSATMVCYPYDHVDSWRAIFPADIFENQFKLLTEEWAEGLEVLKKLGDSSNPILMELYDSAEAAYCHFRSVYLQTKFVRLRDNNECLKDVIDEEESLTIRLANVEARNPTIGYESSNHYWYNRTMLMEKYVNCEYIKNRN